jgi:hypothetical protein
LRIEKFCALLIALPMLRGWNLAQQEQKAPDKASDPVVMRVGERGITVAELCTAIAQLPPPQRKGYALHPGLAKDWYGPLVALAEEAKRKHLQTGENPKLSELDRDNALVGELIQSIAKESEPSNSEIENHYGRHKAEFEQVKVRHILVSDRTALASQSQRSATEAQARAEEIATQLKGGADFAELAEKDSDDPYTASTGGEWGYVAHHQLEPAVDGILWSLAPGQLSAPLQGRFGYEIVQVEERRIQPLDAIRESIIGNLKAAALERREQEIISAAHIRLEPAFVDGSLPCETRAFNLPDRLDPP